MAPTTTMCDNVVMTWVPQERVNKNAKILEYVFLQTAQSQLGGHLRFEVVLNVGKWANIVQLNSAATKLMREEKYFVAARTSL